MEKVEFNDVARLVADQKISEAIRPRVYKPGQWG